MIRGHDSVIVRTLVRALVPPIQLFALYVLFHGHDSPGGGFQAGVILAASYVLVGLALGRAELDRRAPERPVLALAALGTLLFAATAALGPPRGRALLDYAALPGLQGRAARWAGILLVEVGVALAVAGALILIFCRLAKTGEIREEPR